MTLHVVGDYYSTPLPDESPTFEGEPVEHLKARLSSASNLEVGLTPHRIDQSVRLLVTGRVTGIDHLVEARSGRLVRVETFKVVEATEVPWNPTSACECGR